MYLSWWGPVVELTGNIGYLLWWGPVVELTGNIGYLSWWGPVVELTGNIGYLSWWGPVVELTGNSGVVPVMMGTWEHFVRSQWKAETSLTHSNQKSNRILLPCAVTVGLV